MPASCTIGVVTDKTAGALSLVVGVSATGFPVASSSEGRTRRGVVFSTGTHRTGSMSRARVTWQEWCRPGSTDEHSTFIARGSHERPHVSAVTDYADLLDGHGAHATAHDVLLTLSLDVRRIRGGSHWNAAVDVLVDEARQLTSRLSAAGFTTTAPLSPSEIADAVRDRSDPSRRHGVSQSLAAAAGRGGLDWGPIAVEPGWFHVRVDDAIHRSYVMAGWPMLPVTADWLGPLLTVDGAIRTVTVVLEPIPLAAAASDANRQLTSIEADLQQKERHGFRLTARERRRHDDVETRRTRTRRGPSALSTCRHRHRDRIRRTITRRCVRHRRAGRCAIARRPSTAGRNTGGGMGCITSARSVGEARRVAMRATLRHPTGKPSRRNRVDRRVPRRPIRSGSGVELSTEELALSPGWGKAPGVPVEWQRSTMAHLCSVYPFHADVGFGHRGVLLGTNVTAGMSGFYFDPFEFYANAISPIRT